MTDDLPTLREEAARWFVIMRGEDADAHRAAFEKWLARGALHRAAYNRVGEVFAAGKVLKPAGRSSPRFARQWAAVALGLMSASALTCAVLIGRHQFPGQSPRSSETKPGAQSARTLELGSGVRAILDVDGLVSTSGDATVPAVRLRSGRARFTVSDNGQTRLIVAGAIAFHARGATFDLWLRPNGSITTRVLNGSVRIVSDAIRRTSGFASRSLTLSAGDMCRADPGGWVRKVSPASGTEWPDGILEFRRTPLAEVLEEANRYSFTKIRIADPSLGARRLTGRITIADASRLARQIAAALSVDSDESRPGTIFLRVRR